MGRHSLQTESAELRAFLIRNRDSLGFGIAKAGGLALLLLIAVVFLGSVTASPSASEVKSEVVVQTDEWWSYALIDLRSGDIVSGYRTDGMSEVGSLISPWIAYDYLSQTGDDGWLVAAAVQDSHSDAIDRMWRSDRVARLADDCSITGVAPGATWATTAMTATAVARMGRCLVSRDDVPATRVVYLMRHLAPPTGFGIAEIHSGVAAVNGWMPYKDAWRVNCLGIGPTRALAVMTRTQSQEAGAHICREVARQIEHL